MPEGKGNQRSEKGSVGPNSGREARGNQGGTTGGSRRDPGGYKGAPGGAPQSGSTPGGKTGTPAGKDRGFMESIGDLFGGPGAFANNPNAPGGRWNQRDFLTPSYPDANWQAVASSLMEAPLGALGFAGKMMSAAMDPTGPGMGMLGRAMGADYGQRGPDQPGGGVGRANQGGGGAIRPGYELPPGYMQPQPPVPTINPQPTQPSYGNLNMPGKYLGIAPGYGAGVPGYMYPGPMKR